MRTSRPLFLAPPLLALAAVVTWAQPFPEQSLPEGLKPWVPWVLDGAEDRLCPAVDGTAVCLWPGRLALAVAARGASFGLDVFADRAIDLPLPGGEKRWPQAVQVDGRAAAVLDKDGTPTVRLAAGAHRIEGRFGWDRLPDSLPVPADVALVDLTVEGRPVALPRREEDGLLLLRQAGEEGAGGENIQLKVFRRVEDGIPLWVETRIVFEVSGKAREVALTGALLSGARPVAVSGDLPARLDADGRLRVQVRAGTFTVRVLSHLTGQPQTFTPPKTAPPWPGQEVWVFAAAERLRQVELGGAPPIDPSRTDLPEEWRQLPAFLMEAGATLSLKEVRRGEPDAVPDQMTLSRSLWLDENGGGFTVRDAFTGQLGRTTRLNLLGPAELGRVAVDGAGQLVTRDPRSGDAGVEVRKAAIRVEADSRLPQRGSVPAVGWSTNVQALHAELKLPPGWRLLGTSGVDSVPGSWLSRWNLFGFFFVLITGFAAGRLFGPRWGFLAIVTLVLVHGEREAPRLVWLSLLASLAVTNAAPQGFLKALARIWWGLSLLVLIFGLAPFLVDQIRSGLFPQVAGPTEVSPPVLEGFMARRGVAPVPEARPVLGGEEDKAADLATRAVPAAPPPPATMIPGRIAAKRTESNVASVAQYVQTKAYEQDPHAVIQTGAGIPTWSWATYTLTWSGPVDKDHRMRLLLLSPGVNLFLAFVRVVLATLLALRLVAGVFPALGARLRLVPGAVAVVLFLTLGLASPTAAAEDEKKQRPPSGGGLIPSPELLEELKERLTRAPACAPHCVSTASLRLAVDGSELRFEAEVHAGAPAAWPLPGPAESWVPRSVSVDGAPASGLLARLANGFLHVRVAPGLHHVTVAGPLPPKDSLTVQFGQKPRWASAQAPGWQVDGIREDGSADDSVQLSRRLATAAGAGPGRGAGYEAWLEVTRVLDVGVSWNVETLVRRVSPPGTPVVVKVPLIKGMLVTDAEHQVKDGEVLVTLGRDQTEERWSATLKPVEGEAVTLKAPEGRPWSEVWKVNCGLVWQCEVAGLPPVSRLQDGRLAPEFRPWPGESLSLTFRRPKGMEGQTLTIDKASLRVAPGVRLTDATLDLHVRASRTGPLTLTLPQGAEIQTLKVRGTDRPIRPDGQKLSITIEAGDQPVNLAWRQAGGLRLWHRVPPVGLDHPAVNTQVLLQLPESRWLLATGGPAWGPAVLFWGYLVFVLLTAAGLSRVPASPLKIWEWLLLALGLTQIPLFGAVVIAGWFLVLAWRKDRVLDKPALHDLLQVALVLWTLLALVFLYAAVHQGLLLRPDMQVEGGGSSDTLLQWYQDRVENALPSASVWSVPLWVYRVAMLLWSLWLALSLIRWLPWGWGSFTSGSLWRPLRTAKGPSIAPSAAGPPPPPAEP